MEGICDTQTYEDVVGMIFPPFPVSADTYSENAWKQRITAIVKVGLTRFFGLKARNRVG